eukprot:6449363-Karenia_brevis.AAC.1
MPVVAAAAAPQKGFISGRHFTDNLVLVDTTSRVYSNLHYLYGNSVTAFFDFANAFPSLALQWLFLVLRWLKLPRGLINFVHALYHDVHCFLKHAGQVRYMCQVRSGVLQGCPLAALLFVLALEPFVCMFQHTMYSQSIGVIAICADDISIVLKSWRDLIHVHCIFELAQQAAGLTLKPRKCFLVPLSAPLSLHVIDSLRCFLRENIPPWAEFNIAATAEYLGIWLGPGAAAHQWTAQIAKFLQRINVISDAGVAPSLAVKAYNLKAVTVMTYPAQFLAPPPQITKLEKYAFTK